jgi:hypothetical protein
MYWSGKTVMVSVLLLSVDDEELQDERRQADYVIELGDTMFFPLETGTKLHAEPGPEPDTLILRWKNPTK